MIFLYDQTESSFSSMGRGPIADALSCKVSYSDSGAYELELEYPVNGPLHNYLVHRAIIYAKPNRVRGFQPFRIDEISRPTNGKIRYYAKHISYDLSGVPISAYTIEKTTDGTAMTQAVAGIASHAFIQSVSPFTFSTTKNSLKYRDTEFKLEEPSSAREVMDKINDTYKYGVWDFDGYNCVLYSTGEDNTDTGAVMGRDNGVVLYYGRDFIDATQESKFESMVSGIYPFWKSSSVSTQGSVASKLLSGLQAYINGDKNASSIAQDTGLSIERVKELITEYRNNNPHTVDLSFLAGETTSEPSTVSATDTHTGDGVTTTFTLGIKFKSISKVTIDDKNVGDAKYEYNAGYNSITFTRETPANGSTIKIIGVVPELVELPEKVYAPSGYTPGYVKVVPVNLSSEFNSAPLESDLRQKAIEYWTENKLGTPEVSLSLTYKDIKRIAEYTNINCAEDLDLGDLVTVNFVNMGICEKVKITRIEYDPINDIYTALDLGEPKATLALTIVQAKQDIANKPDTNEVNQVTEDAVISMVTKYALSNSKDDCPQPVLDADGNDSVWQEVAPAPVSGKYLWRKTVTTYASGKVISDGHTCIDNGSSDNTTAISSSLAGTQTVYYVKTGSSAPSAPSGWVSSTSTASNQWTTKIPDPIHNGHYYVCTQSRAKSGAVSNSAVVEDKNNTLLLSWTDNTSVTQINGGLIAANTVAASSIIAHSITADQLSTDAITSDNYEYVSGVYSRDGTKIDLATGYIRSKYFAVDQYGNAYLRGEVHTSNGSLGNFNIVGTTSTNYGSGLELYRSDAGTQWLAAVVAEDCIALVDGLMNPSSFSVDRTDPYGIETRWFNNYYSMALKNSGITLGSSGAQLLVNESPSGRRGILSGNWYTDANTTYTIEYRLATLEAGLDVNRHLFAVAKTAASSAFNSQAASITITSNFTDVSGNTVDISALSIGDTFYVTDTGVPDRWVAAKASGSVTLYVLETTRIPVTDVQVNGTSIVSNTIANITVTTGDSNGQIKIAGQNISVKGLAALAYKNSVTTNDIDVTGGSANQVLAISGQAASWTTLGDLAWLNSITINKVTDAESWIANKNYITRSGIDATAPITYNSSNGKIGISLGSGLTTTGTPAQLILDTEYLDQNYVNNPMTNVGDLIVGGTGGEPTAISKGSAGQVLSSTANGLAWITLPADTNTWRDVGVNGEPWKGTGINTGAIDFTDNTGIAITTGTGQNANKLYIGLANTYGDSKNPYGSKTAHYVLAAPSNQNGVPTFRVLDASDIPNLSYTKITGIGATAPISYTGGTIALSYDDTLTNDGGTLSVNVATILSGYATESWVNNQGFLKTVSLSMAQDNGTPAITLAANRGYKITTNGTTYIFKTPADNDTLYTLTKSGNNLVFHSSDSETQDTTITFGSNAWNSTAIPAPYTSTPANIGTASAGSSSNYARGDHVHDITVTSGPANGQVTVGGHTVSVAGLKALAYLDAPDDLSSGAVRYLVYEEPDGYRWDALTWADIGSKPTTIAGYGITDAKIQNGAIKLGSNTITPVTSIQFGSGTAKTGNAITVAKADITALGIPGSDTNTTYTLNVSGTGTNAGKVGLVAGGSGSGTTWYTIPYATAAGEAAKDSDSNTIADYYGHALTVSGNTIGLKNAQDDDITGSFITVPYATVAGSASSVTWANVSGHVTGVKADLAINATSGSTSKYLSEKGTWVSLPSDVNTWRPVKYGSTTLNDTSTTLEFVAGTNIGLAFSSGKLTITNNYSYTLPLAANGTRGGIQIGYSPAANTKKYAVKLESEKAYVEVPWTDTTYSLAVGTGSDSDKIVLNQNGTAMTPITVPYATVAGKATNDDANNQISSTYGHSLIIDGNTIGLENGNGDTISGSFITVPYATNAGTAASANSVAWANVSGHDAGVDSDLGINTSSGSTTKYLSQKGTWVSLPSDVNTWRDIGVNGDPWKGTGTGTGPIDFTNDTGISITTGTGQDANKLYIGVDTTKIPLITSLGDLAWLDTITNAKITGGTSGYLLKSNGTSAASWVSPSTLTVSHAATAESIYDPEGQVTYTIEHSVPSDAVFTDTTYTFANGTNGFTVTPAGGTAQTVTVTPSIANNVTGSGTSGYLAKFSGTNTITNAVQYATHATNSTIAQRTENGYLLATYFNTSVGEQNPASYTSSPAFIDSNGYLRKSSKSTFINWINPDIQAYEAKLQWGGRNFSGSYGPIDAAMIGTLGANRFELLRSGTADNPGIEVFYSRDAGSTWIDYGLNGDQKRNIFNSTVGNSVIIGKRASSDTKSVDDRAKIVIHTGVASVYTQLNKFALYVSTAGSGNCWVTIDKCIQNKDYSVESNWENVVTKVPISGWSGWNIINTSSITTYGNSPASQYGHLRFIFGADTAGSTSYSGLGAVIIAGFGGVGWTTPSYLAKYGHAYTWNSAGDASFQAGLSAYGSITANARNGTASTTGLSYLIAGNSTASGTNYNSRGVLRLYGTGSGYAHIRSVSLDSTSTTYSLPAYSTNQYIASVEDTGVTSGALAEFNSATGHMVSGPKYDTAASNSTIARRTSNGYLYATYFNTTVGQFNPSSYTNPSVAFVDQDGWLRKSSKTNFLTWLGISDARLLPSYSSSDRGKFLVVSEGDGSPAWETLYWSDISSTPTTLGGYGITDAKIQNGTITLGSNSITPMSNPMTAANDIIVGGTNGAATKLVKGSNGTFLGINSSGNVAWVDNPVPFNGDNDNEVLMWDGTDEKAFWCAPLWMEKLIFNAGEIIIGNSSGNPIALSNGSTGQVLTTISSGDRVAWRNATVRASRNTGSTALPVLLATSSDPNGSAIEAYYANTTNKQLKFTPSTGNLSGVAQINGSTVPSSPKFTDTLADYITEWNNETEPTGEALGIVKYAYDHTPALYLDSITYSDMVHSWSTSSNIAMLTMTNTYTSNGGSTNPVLTLSSYPVQNTGTVFKLINNTAQSSNNWLSALDIMAPNMTASSNMNYANFTIFNCGKAASNNNRGSLVYHHTADGSLYNCLTMGFYGNDHVFRVYAYGGAWIYGSLYVENGNKVATEAWVNSHFVPTCLIKGTKILMADGTEKNIEDVKRGDEVKSIDINSGKIITAMVVSCEKTGVDHEYTTHLFDNGSYIVTYGLHSVYNKTLGHPIDISKFRIGDETYDAEGKVITYAGNMRYYDRSTDVAHYDINTSNNLYFANGILNGKNVFAKYRCMRRENMDIPDSILAVLNRQETANKPAIGYETDSNYFRAIAAKLKEKSTIAKRIEEAKQKLADSDYLVAKFTEGLISAVDWLKAKAERSNWRTAINNDEPLLEAADNAIKAIKAKYQTDDSSVKDRFELFSAWDNAALEYYREWLTKEKSIDIPGPLTEEERHGSYVNQDLT